MAQRSGFFDASAGDRSYSSADWARVHFRLWAGEGVDRNYANRMTVTETSPPSMGVRVDLGWAWIQGYWLEVHTAAETLALSPPNHPTLPRVDLVVARLDRSAAQRRTYLAKIDGTPSATPTAPLPVTSDPYLYDIPLAEVTVNPGVTTITNANIVDRRISVGLGTVPRGTSSSSVGVSPGDDFNTGFLFPLPGDIVQIVAGGTVGVHLAATQVVIGNLAGITSVAIGHAGIPTTVSGSLVVSEGLTALAALGVGGLLSANAGFTANGYGSFIGGNLDLSSTTGGIAALRVIGGQNAYSQFTLIRPDSVVQANFILGHTGNQFLGSAGDLQIYTGGTGAGRLILGAQGVSVLHVGSQLCHIGPPGLAAGVGRLNVFPVGVAANGGINLYNGGNYGVWTAIWQDSPGRTVFGSGAGSWMFASNSGYVTIGTVPVDHTRFSIWQLAAAAADGMYIGLSGTGYYSRYFIGSGGHANLWSYATQTILRADVASFAPAVDQGAHLGYPDTRWANLYVTAGVFYAGVSIAGLLSANGGITTTNITATSFTGGTHTGSTGAFTGTVSAPEFNSSSIIQMQHTGGVSNYMHLGIDSAGKPGTSTWAVISDPRSKDPGGFEPYLPGLTELLQFRPEWYTYNGEFDTPKGERHIGIRVEHLQETDAAHMVAYGRAAIEDPEQNEADTPLQVNYHALPMVLVNAMHDLYGVLQEQGRRIASLEAQLNGRRN